MVNVANNNSIVMVDDNEMDLKIANKFLKRSVLKNQFVGLQSGEELLNYLQSVKAREKEMPALVLLDVNMPSMDGHTTLRRIKELPEFCDLPFVLMFSNSNFEKDIQTAKIGGAIGYQVKPQGAQEYIEFFNSLSSQSSLSVASRKD